MPPPEPKRDKKYDFSYLRYAIVVLSLAFAEKYSNSHVSKGYVFLLLGIARGDAPVDPRLKLRPQPHDPILLRALFAWGTDRPPRAAICVCWQDQFREFPAGLRSVTSRFISSGSLPDATGKSPPFWPTIARGYPRDGSADSEQKISTTLTQGRSKRARFFFGTIGSAVPQRRDTVRDFYNSLPILDV